MLCVRANACVAYSFVSVQYPLSPFQAFAIVLSAVDGKMADSKKFAALKKLAADKAAASASGKVRTCDFAVVWSVTSLGSCRVRRSEAPCAPLSPHIISHICSFYVGN